MFENYIGLVRCADGGAPLLNMRVQMATQPLDAPVQGNITPRVIDRNPESTNQSLADFDEQPDSDDGLVERTAIQMINQIKNLDATSVDKYTLNYNLYDNEASISISCSQPPTTELIQRFSFTITMYDDPSTGPTCRIYIGGLFVNKKYMDVGSNLLEIAKTAMKSMVAIGQLTSGAVELWSVETAVFFYIKNGFVVRSLFDTVDPQSKVQTTHKIIHLAMKEDNVEIVKQFAKITPDNFLDFINYLLENTKYGKYFKAYFDNIDDPADIEKSVMQSRFISSLFDTSMIYQYFRDLTKTRVTLKPLTM